MNTGFHRTELLIPWAGRPITRAALAARALGRGRFFFRMMALGLIGAGLFALLQSATGRFLSHDLRYLGMDTIQLCGVSNGRVARFMFHDRVSFGGALIAIGLLYLWLEQFPLKAGEIWAWWTFLLAGFAGFGSFLAYLGYGYLDSWHALATLALLPLYVGGLAMTWDVSRHNETIAPPALRSKLEWRTRLALGRGLLLATAAGLMAGGITILLIGMTRVFVPQDLRYLKLGASDLLAMNRRLLPLIAHDRAAFGGAIATCGLLFCCVRFGRPSRSLWLTVASAATTGFITAIGVHPIIGYTEFSHLAPAYLGAAMFSIGTAVCQKPMCGGLKMPLDPAARLARATNGFS